MKCPYCGHKTDDVKCPKCKALIPKATTNKGKEKEKKAWQSNSAQPELK